MPIHFTCVISHVRLFVPTCSRMHAFICHHLRNILFHAHMFIHLTCPGIQISCPYLGPIVFHGHMSMLQGLGFRGLGLGFGFRVQVLGLGAASPTPPLLCPTHSSTPNRHRSSHLLFFLLSLLSISYHSFHQPLVFSLIPNFFPFPPFPTTSAA